MYIHASRCMYCLMCVVQRRPAPLTQRSNFWWWQMPFRRTSPTMACEVMGGMERLIEYRLYPRNEYMISAIVDELDTEYVYTCIYL